MKHVCFNWLPKWPRASTRMHPQTLWRLLCGLHFEKKCIGHSHEVVDNLSSELVHHGKAGNRRLYTIRDRIAVPRYINLEQPRGRSFFKGRRLFCIPWFFCRWHLLGLVPLESRVAEGDGILGGVRYWGYCLWSIDPRVFLRSVPVMKPLLTKKDCIFCPVDVQVDLVKPGSTQNHANIFDVGLQESVSTTQNDFELVLDLDYCNVALIDL